MSVDGYSGVVRTFWCSNGDNPWHQELVDVRWSRFFWDTVYIGAFTWTSKLDYRERVELMSLNEW